MFPGVSRGPRLAACLGDWQRVHVCPQPDGAPHAELAADEANDTSPADAGHNLVDAKFLRFRFDEVSRLFHCKLKFWIPMRVASPLGYFCVKFDSAFQDWHQHS